MAESGDKALFFNDLDSFESLLGWNLAVLEGLVYIPSERKLGHRFHLFNMTNWLELNSYSQLQNNYSVISRELPWLVPQTTETVST